MRTIKNIDITGKRVLIRVDVNVPLDENLNITDDSRIRAVLPTINYALDEDAKVIMASHMGRPEGKVVPELSLAPVAKRFSRLLKKEVQFAQDCIGPEVKALVNNMQQGDVLLLENLRFHLGEQENDDSFAKELASMCDVYVNDAFAVAHRENASVVAITRYAPICASGFLLKSELNYFTQALEDPAHPLVAIIGGAKVSNKLGALKNLLKYVDNFLIGGAMANTFLKSVDYDVGESLVEDSLLWEARSLMKKATQMGVGFYIPVDAIVADRFDAKAETKIVPIQEVPPEWLIMDIGPATSLLYSEVLASAKTIVWNGPMGIFEITPFDEGTKAVALAVAEATDNGATSIIGGGDSASAVNILGLEDRISHISTGGGASLEFLEGKTLPGLAALTDK